MIRFSSATVGLVAGLLLGPAAAVSNPASGLIDVHPRPLIEQVDRKSWKDDRRGPPRHKGRKHAYRGGPPPWAPAHGFRSKRGYHYDDRDKVYIDRLSAPPLDLGIGRCNREVLGQLTGAAAGAAIGSQIGDGRGRLAAVAAGTLIGVLLGGEVGRSMDRTDRLCADEALEHAADGQPIVWTSGDGRERRQVIPEETWRNDDGRYCREYTARSTIGGRLVTTYGTACRQPDGAWKIIRQGG